MLFVTVTILAIILAMLGCYLVKNIPEQLVSEVKEDQKDLESYVLPDFRSYHAYTFYFLSIALFIFMATKFTGIQLYIVCGFTWFAILLAILDWRVHLITDNLVYPFLWTGLMVNSLKVFCTPIEAIYGAIFGYILLWTFNYLGKLVTKKQIIGNGDMKMLAALGAWFGVMGLFKMLVYISALSFICLLIYKIFYPKEKEVPFAIVLSLASLAYLINL